MSHFVFKKKKNKNKNIKILFRKKVKLSKVIDVDLNMTLVRNLSIRVCYEVVVCNVSGL
jgi:hypothetical protein